MIKYLFILINSLMIFLYGIFTGDNGITVTGNIPATMVAGQEAPIEIKINKGNMNGFAKFQLDLPEGFTIKESEDKGATYSFNEGIAKWVWAALPPESEIVIKVTVVPGDNSLGAKTISAKYSYVENNVKQVVEMPPAEVNVTASGSAPVVSAPVTTEPTVAPVPPPAPDTTATAVIPPVTSNVESPGKVTVTRKTQLSGTANQYVVNLIINKDGTKGFARYSDDLPENVTVLETKTDGASFSLADGKIKFVWVNVPESETLEISYIISSSTSQTVSLQGEYSYLEDNQSKKYVLEPAQITFEASEVAKAPEKQNETAPVEPSTPEKEVKKEKPAKEKAALANATEKQSQPAIEPIQEPMVYLVQIGAFTKKKITATKLRKKFKFSETIRSDMDGGFTKFMVGSHQEYKQARDHRETIIAETKIKTAFVVAYNHGKRITVQEALMITNQKWFK